MIDDVLKMILAIPELTISSDANIELLKRTNNLGSELAVDSFNKHIADKKNGASCFSRAELKQINKFLIYWEELQNKLNEFAVYFHFAFRILNKNKMITGDDLLPLFICMMPDDLAMLEKLNDALVVITNIDRCYYYGTVLHMAVLFLINEKKHPQVANGNAAADEMLFQKSNHVVALLRNNLLLLDITKNLADTFYARKTELEKTKENETLSQTNVRLAYQELYDALITNDKSLPNRILEIIKVCANSEDLQNDFIKAKIPLNQAMNVYLEIPPTHHYSLFGSRHTHHSEVPLTTLFTHLDKKLKNVTAPSLTLQ